VDYTEYIDIAYLGEGSYPSTPSVEGLPYRRPKEWYDANAYQIDAALATQHFQSAFGGQLWDTGFTLPLVYNEGNEPRRVIAEMLEENIEALNPLFSIEVQSAPWGEVMIPELFNGELTTFVIGWHMDYPDPHNFYQPYFHSTGVFAHWQNYANPEADVLIEAGVATTVPAEREAIYYDLQALYISEVPSVCTLQPAGRHWQRDWVQGWYFNPGISGQPGVYNNHLWKEALPTTDMNDDGNVDIFDVVGMATSFGSFYEVGNVHPDWDSTADLNLDEIVDIFDVVTIAKDFGFVAPPWTPPA
jgi:peptide/nickel transport system substrate-binding protein